MVRGLAINRFAGSGITVITDPLGTLDLGNSDSGVLLGSAQSTVGGTTPEARNLISGNDLGGLLISRPGGNKVLGNLIGTKKGGKGALGNLRFGGVFIANGAANNLQNFPILGKATTQDGKTVTKGNLDSAPNKTYVVRFFSNPSGQNEGKTFLGQRKVMSGPDGVVSYAFSPARAVKVGKTITATDKAGNTSEFSEPKSVVAS